jgi:hypothetical protein
MRLTATLLSLLLLLACPPEASARDLDFEDSLEFGLVEPVAVDLTEVVLEVPVRIRPVGAHGRVERIQFANMRINGVPFEVEAISESFELPEHDSVPLPTPLRLHLNLERAAPGIIEEALIPGKELRLTGDVTVVGEFRVWIFSSKRTVKLDVDESRPNPLHDYHPLRLALEQLKNLDDLWPF